MKKIYTAFLLSIIYLSQSQLALACSVCFKGDADDPASKGLRGGIIALLVVLIIVLSLFSTFFINIWRRSKNLGETS